MTLFLFFLPPPPLLKANKNPRTNNRKIPISRSVCFFSYNYVRYRKKGRKNNCFFFCFCCFVLFFRSPLFFVLYPLLLIEIITKKRRILSFPFSLFFVSLSLCLANKSEFLQLNYFEWCSSSPVSYSKGRYDK